MGKQMKVVCEKTINGVTGVYAITTPTYGDQGYFLKSVVGAGNPFWAWPSIPSGHVIGADFTGAPICTDDSVTNNALIAGITVAPEDVLVYEPTA